MKYGDEEEGEGKKDDVDAKNDDSEEEEEDEEEEEEKKHAVGARPKSTKHQAEDKPIDKEFKKLLNELEIRFKKDETQVIKDKKALQKQGHHKIKKMVSLVAKGQLVVGVVCHVLGDDNTGEFDPYFVDRIKNTMQLMVDKHFVEVIESDIRVDNTFLPKQEQESESKDAEGN